MQNILVYLNYFLTAVGTVATTAAVLSTMVKRDSSLGQWLAWIASMPIKHIPAKPPNVAPLLPVMIVFGISSTQSGCSLEAARTKRLNSQFEAVKTAQAPAKARPESECRFLDGVHIWGDWTAGGLAAVGAGAGVFASSTRDDDVKRAAIWTGVGAAALGAVAIGVAEQSASTWAEQCQ